MTITLAQAVRNAVEAERAAGRFYRQLCERADDDRVREFLEGMASQEDDHAESLERLGKTLVEGDLAQHADGNVSTVETAPAWAEAEVIDLEQAIEVAIEAEHHAALYYDALSDGAPQKVAQFFSKLSLKEEQHAQQLIELKKKGRPG